MRHLTIELYPNHETGEITVWRSAPAFGTSHETAKGAVQYGVLSDTHNRVKFAVFNATLPIPLIKAIARMALETQCQKESEPAWTLN